MNITKRAIRNGAILALVIALIGLYQGESIITSLMVWLFTWPVISGALWLSYKMTSPKKEKAAKTED